MFGMHSTELSATAHCSIVQSDHCWLALLPLLLLLLPPLLQMMNHQDEFHHCFSLMPNGDDVKRKKKRRSAEQKKIQASVVCVGAKWINEFQIDALAAASMAGLA